MASNYHDTASLTNGEVLTVDTTRFNRMDNCDRHEVEVNGSAVVTTRKKGKAASISHGTFTDEAKAIELSNLEQITITASGAAEVSVTGIELSASV